MLPGAARGARATRIDSGNQAATPPTSASGVSGADSASRQGAPLSHISETRKRFPAKLLSSAFARGAHARRSSAKQGAPRAPIPPNGGRIQGPLPPPDSAGRARQLARCEPGLKDFRSIPKCRLPGCIGGQRSRVEHMQCCTKPGCHAGLDAPAARVSRRRTDSESESPSRTSPAGLPVPTSVAMPLIHA
jgi:hypothetical protein